MQDAGVLGDLAGGEDEAGPASSAPGQGADEPAVRDPKPKVLGRCRDLKGDCFFAHCVLVEAERAFGGLGPCPQSPPAVHERAAIGTAGRRDPLGGGLQEQALRLLRRHPEHDLDRYGAAHSATRLAHANQRAGAFDVLHDDGENVGQHFLFLFFLRLGAEFQNFGNRTRGTQTILWFTLIDPDHGFVAQTIVWFILSAPGVGAQTIYGLCQTMGSWHIP